MSSIPPEDSRPLHEQTPPQVRASPGDMVRGADEEIVWWKPSWRDSIRYVGYRWLYLTPALGLIALAAVAVFRSEFRAASFAMGVKLALTLVVPTAAALLAYVIRRAARARTEPFCIHCGYNLTGLPDHHRCPECGRPYAWKLIDEYRRDPAWFIQRYKAHQKLPDAQAPFEAGPARSPRRRDGT